MRATIGKLKNPELSQIDRLPLPPQPPYHPKGGPIGICGRGAKLADFPEA